MIEWKDITSYSQKEPTEGRVPQVWEAKSGILRIRVHRHIHYEPDVWLLTTYPDLLRRHQLNSKDIDDAKREALRLVHQVLFDQASILQDAI